MLERMRKESEKLIRLRRRVSKRVTGWLKKRQVRWKRKILVRK